MGNKPGKVKKSRIDYASLFHNEYTAWLVLGLSIAITLFAWNVSRQYGNTQAVQSFQFETEDARQRILFRMRTYEQALRGGVALFNASERISREEWKTYVESLRLNDTLPGLQGYGFAQVIQPSDLKSHEIQVRSEGFPGYEVRPGGERDLYTSIVFLEPFDFRNRRAFGFDMYSEETRRAAMDRAIDTGKTAVSGLVRLKQETETDIQAGFLMYLPVYSINGLPQTVEERRKTIKGFVYSPFRAKDLMLGVLGKNAIPLTFQLYDGQGTNPDSLLYDSRQTSLEGSSPPEGFEPAYTEQNNLSLPGRSWTVVFQSTPVFESLNQSVQPQLILVAGAIIDVLLFLVISSLAQQRKQLAQRNSEMEIMQSRYSGVVDGLQENFAFFSLSAEARVNYFSPSLPEFMGLEELQVDDLFTQSIPDPEHAQVIAEAISRARSSGEIVSFTLTRDLDSHQKKLKLLGLINPTLDADG
ncbi:MAG: CHASE domain-containing protein, partial [Limnobacter sp.]|nr:CHASE domain-containing protein [Limnobacter sp.]